MKLNSMEIKKEFLLEEGELETEEFKEFDSKMLELGWSNKITESNMVITYTKKQTY